MTCPMSGKNLIHSMYLKAWSFHHWMTYLYVCMGILINWFTHYLNPSHTCKFLHFTETHRVGWGKTPPLRVWWTSWSHTLLEHSIFLWHDSALLVEHTCQFQLLWVYTFLYDSSLNGAFPKGQLAPWVGQDAPLPRASRPLGGNLPHGRGRFAPSVI